jgi:hypothetical protein
MINLRLRLPVLLDYMLIIICLLGYVMSIMISFFVDFTEDIMEVFIDDFSIYGTSFNNCLSSINH